MKINKLFYALSLGLVFVGCQPKDAEVSGNDAADEATSEEIAKPKTAKDFLPSRQERKDVSYLVGINFGSFIKGYNFGELDMAEVRRGMEDFINSKQSSDPDEFAKQFRVDPNRMNELFNNYLGNRRSYTIYTNKEREEAFLAKNAKKDGVQVLPSGLQYKIISAGNELHPTVADTVYVSYKGSLLDGTVFDETKGEAVSLVLGRTVNGWKEALPLIGEGGEMEIYIPYALGYGENGTRGIGPAETLIFNVSLDKVGVTNK